jgi:tetratricopeptide (TPR) repeat protein
MSMHFPRCLLPAALLLAIAAPFPIHGAEKKPAPPEYVEAVRTALRSFGDRDFAQVLAALDRAEAILPPTPLTLNTRGAVLLEQRKFAEGEKLCRQALELDPKFYPARFNLCEIPMMQKRYGEARAMFQKLLDQQPKDELTRYRILLTWLLEKNDAEARRTLELLPFPGDTPAYYYGNAAWHFAHGEEEEAQKWMVRGNWVFPKQVTVNFSDTFRDVGWIKEAPANGGNLPDAGTGSGVVPRSTPESSKPAPAE